MPLAPSVTELRYAGVDVHATLPAQREPVTFGLHGSLAEHYGLADGSYAPAPATLDYLVAATAACMLATFGDALAARGIPVDELSGRAEGRFAQDRGVVRLEAVRIDYRLTAVDRHADIERVHAVHARACPMHQSIGAAVAISTRLAVESPARDDAPTR